jgi:uncharacterized membrane protein
VTGSEKRPTRSFPLSAGLLLGLGLGGFFDGIVLHQLLQWHHMVSSWYPITSIENLELNTFWDGVFHSGTYVFVLAGLFILWRCGRLSHFRWSTGDLVATMLIGFGLFNLACLLLVYRATGAAKMISAFNARALTASMTNVGRKTAVSDLCSAMSARGRQSRAILIPIKCHHCWTRSILHYGWINLNIRRCSMEALSLPPKFAPWRGSKCVKSGHSGGG